MLHCRKSRGKKKEEELKIALFVVAINSSINCDAHYLAKSCILTGINVSMSNPNVISPILMNKMPSFKKRKCYVSNETSRTLNVTWSLIFSSLQLLLGLYFCGYVNYSSLNMD